MIYLFCKPNRKDVFKISILGENLRKMRSEKGLSLNKLASISGINKSTISEIENNKILNPSNKTLQKLSDALECSIDYLTGNSVKSLIENRLSELDMTTEELSKKADVPINFINNLDEYICPNEGDYKHIEKIALALNLQPSVLKSALARQEAPVYDNKISSIPSDDFEPVNNFQTFKIELDSFVNIPIVGSVRAGTPILAQDNIEGYQPTLKDSLCNDKEYFYLRVQGDSMNLEFNEGSLLLIEKAPWVENGTIAVVLIDGMEATVKKVIQNENMVTLIPMSTNPEHVPHMYDVVKDKIAIVGKVKQAIKIY